MAISLQSLRRSKDDRPPMILAYGPEKTGKTTLANEFPNAVFLQTEEGFGNLELDTFGKLNSFADVMEAITALYEGDDHGYQTVVVDSVTALQPMIWAETGERGDDKGNKKQRIEDFGYGKGYTYALAVWQELLDGLNALRRDRGMTVILIAHAVVKRIDDPETVAYSRHDIDLDERASNLLKRECDVILLVKPDVTIKSEDQGFGKSRAIADGGRNVWIYATSRPAYVAGNRYGMPDKTLFRLGAGYAELAQYLPGGAPPAAANEPEAASAAPSSRKKAA